MEYIVSFCIAVYNKADATYNLVQSLLSNQNPRFQVVISDNASTDDTVERLLSIEDSRLKVVVNPTNLGPEKNWGKALENGDGRFLYFIIGRDVINPKRIGILIDLLEQADALGVKLLRDGPCGRLADETESFQVFTGVEAIKRFMRIEHPSGLIYHREAYKRIKNRQAYYNLKDVYPELRIQRDLLLNAPAAKISAYVYYGKAIPTLRSVKSVYQKDKLPFYCPAKRVAQHIKLMNMIIEKMDSIFSRRELDEIIADIYKRMMFFVTLHWKDIMNSAEHAGHYKHELRIVSKAEQCLNVIKASNTVNRYFGYRFGIIRRLKLIGITAKTLCTIVWE